MAVDLFFDPPTVDIPAVYPMRIFRWQNLPSAVARFVATEEQYLRFHLTLLDRLHYTAPGCCDDNPRPYAKPLGLTLRAGAIKSAVLLTASIAEAALRAIAEARGYDLPAKEKHRTLGKILGAWEENGKPRADVAAVWDVLWQFHDVRNNIHLFKAASDPKAGFEAVLAQEKGLVEKLLPTLDVISEITAKA